MTIKARPFDFEYFKAVISLILLAASSIRCEEGIYIENLNDLDKEMSPVPDALEHEICPREVSEGREDDPHHVVYFDSKSEPELSYVDSVDVAINDESEENNFDKPTFNVFSNYFPEKPKESYFMPKPQQDHFRKFNGRASSFLVENNPEAEFFASLKEESRAKGNGNGMFSGLRRFSNRLPVSRLNQDKTQPHQFENTPKRHGYFKSEVYRYMKPRKSGDETFHGNSVPLKRFDYLSKKLEKNQEKRSVDPQTALKKDIPGAKSA